MKKKIFTQTSLSQFRKVVHRYYQKNARKLPWRGTKNPYHIFVSEIMLQQTQVERVIEKYQQFIAAFPDVETLSRAPLKDILKVWQGMGYNRRALYLKKAAQRLVQRFGGKVPASEKDLVLLPGIGKATASSIAAFAFNAPTVFIETNIRSVFIHHFFPDKKTVSDEEIRPLVAKTLDRSNPRRWYSALMDYGTMLKNSLGNPNIKSKHYAKQKPFKGSHRQLRGKMVKLFSKNESLTLPGICQAVGSTENVEATLAELVREGFLKKMKGRFILAQ